METPIFFLKHFLMVLFGIYEYFAEK